MLSMIVRRCPSKDGYYAYSGDRALRRCNYSRNHIYSIALGGSYEVEN